MMTNDNNNQRSMISCVEKWEITIIGLCVILLLAGALTFFVKEWWLTPQPKVIELRVTSIDSLGVSKVYSSPELDSLSSEFNKAIKSYDEHYQYVQKEREEDERMKSLGLLLLSVISSIALFYGFRSFKDITDKWQDTAKTIAEENSREVAKVEATNAAKEYFNGVMPGKVKESVDQKFQGEGKNSLRDSIQEAVKPFITSEVERVVREIGTKEKDGVEETEQIETASATMPPLTFEEMFNESDQTDESPSDPQNTNGRKEGEQ